MTNRNAPPKHRTLVFCVLGISALIVWSPASSGTLTVRADAVGASSPGATSLPGLPMGPGAAGPQSAMPSFGTNGGLVMPGSSNPSYSPHGPDQKWGEPLGADVLDSGKVHAKLDYFMDSSRNGSETGVGVTLTFTN
jgi:hypothetical protein